AAPQIHRMHLPSLLCLALLACTGAADRAESTEPPDLADSAERTAPADRSGTVDRAAADTAPGVAALEREFARIEAESGGTMGIAVIHVETGRRASYNGTMRFPMQSVYKLPIAAALLKRVEEGKVDLDQEVAVRAADLRWGHSPVAERHPRGGGEYTVRELMRLAVAESDNTASDLLLPLAGGPGGVTQFLWGFGLDSILVSRPEGQLILDFHGARPSPGATARAATDSLIPTLPAAARDEGWRKYLADPRDTSTPGHMARLLVLLRRGELLSPQHTALLLRTMTETETGPNRLRGRLPAGTRVAHKTGTSASWRGTVATVNDAGLIPLPNGRGHLAVAVFVKEAKNGLPTAEAAIARAARAAYDHWAR
ncbi:MAG TPA: class A beta-lactamase, partial [Longimicrobium sp.]|nr:class A beta-lactamase [Longimicrobium sp.]